MSECLSSSCQLDVIRKLRDHLATAEVEVERLRASERQFEIDRAAALTFVGWVAKHPDVGDSLTAVEREKTFQARAREVYSDARVTAVHPNDVERTAAESHCAKCVRCRAYKKMADDEATRHAVRANSYEQEMRQIVSYLGHYDQDANHAWMVRRIRAVLAGKNPNAAVGWTEHDGVRAPATAPDVVVGVGYEPPKELWFHFHPAPHVVMPDHSERLAASGTLWHDPFETEEEAEETLGESAADGWKVIGPYTYAGRCPSEEGEDEDGLSSLQRELEQLETVNPVVGVAAKKYDETVCTILAAPSLAKKDPYVVHLEGPVAPDVLWVLIVEIRDVADTREVTSFTSQAAAETVFRESLKYTGMRSRLFSYGVLAEWST